MTPEMEAMLEESAFLAGRGKRPEAVEVADPGGVGRVIDALCRTSQQEMLVFHDPAVSATLALASDERVSDAQDEDLLRRGVVIRQVTAAGPLPSSQVPERPRAEFRSVAEIPFKLLAFDRKVALLPLQPELRTLHLGAVVIRDPAVVGALLASFRAVWQNASPTTPSPAMPTHDALPAHLHLVVESLLAGQVDATAARRLGISARTYSRRVAELLGLLGVHSRTQVGAAAAARGWHSPT